MEIKELDKRFEKGFKLDYSKIRKAVLKCELDKKSSECKKALQELNIPIYEDDWRCRRNWRRGRRWRLNLIKDQSMYFT